MHLFSPAKINLFLRVTKRRDDGYHELSTLMQAVDLGDYISIDHAQTDFFTCSESSIPTDPTNLVWRAVKLFREKTGLLDPVAIRLEKKIPVEAGLGGGSGNAATTLWGINQLFDCPCLEEQLREWSVQLGADVPFFFSPGTAYCTGIGEFVEPRPLTPATYFLHKPPYGLSTASIFKGFDLSQASYSDCLYHNDLEARALAVCPPLAQLKAELTKSYQIVFMTGSGTGLIGIGGSHAGGIALHPISRTSSNWYVQLSN